MNHLEKVRVRKFRNMLFNKQKYNVIHYVTVCNQQICGSLPMFITVLAILHGMSKVRMEGC